MVLEHLEPQLDQNGVSTVTQSISSRPTVVRKKFAKPPVKVACLACRASRTRCDGQEPCNNCVNKKKTCSYLPSKRGGPRKRKKGLLPAEEAVQKNGFQDSDATLESAAVEVGSLSQTPSGLRESDKPQSEAFQDIAAAMFGQIDALSVPGAGLRGMDFASDVHSMFAGLFIPNDANSTHVQIELTPSPTNASSQTLVRTYGSEHDILNAYYDFVHNYFPVLPPRVAPPSVDRPVDNVGSYTETPSEEPVLIYRPRSPLSLAISAVLALIPHPNDPEPSSPTSVIRRRTYAHTFAQMANISIESDCELHASFTSPSQALSSDRPLIDREPFHPQTPAELESILALLILSTYEYTQRGNLLKMRYRSGQALAMALDMSLHSLGEEYDKFAEARRRAWWMTYYCVLQGSIVGTAPLSIAANDPQFITPYPRFSSDPDAWRIFIQAQQVLVSASQFVIDLKKCIRTGTNVPYIYERMQHLDAWAGTALAQSSVPPMVSPPLDGSSQLEHTTAQSIRAISRIKLSSAQIKVHRFRAFSDIPIFIKKHCDLTSANTSESDSSDTTKDSKPVDGAPGVGCCTSLDQFQQPSSGYTPSSTSSTSSDIQALPHYSFTSAFPFTSQHSSRVCLRASMLISRTFQSLPVPQPLIDAGNPSQILQLLPQNHFPRTMPSFACCLMQGSYAMLMLFYKARVGGHDPLELGSGSVSTRTDRFFKEIRQGLERIIAAVSNYAIAFEALDGMRDEIEGAYQTAFSHD